MIAPRQGRGAVEVFGEMGHNSNPLASDNYTYPSATITCPHGQGALCMLFRGQGWPRRFRLSLEGERIVSRPFSSGKFSLDSNLYMYKLELT